MACILVLQHGEVQTSGRIGRTFRDHGFDLDVRRLDLDPTNLPPDLDGIHGIVSLGGPQNVSDNPAWLEPEMDLIRRGVEQDLMVLGVCLGHQVIATALGGEVGRLETPVVGFEQVQPLFPAYAEVLLNGVAWSPFVFSSHAYHVSKAHHGASVLQKSASCPVESVRFGMRSISFSWHFEADREMIEAISEQAEDLREAAGVSMDDVRRQIDEHYERFARASDRICANLVALAFPTQDLLAR